VERARHGLGCPGPLRAQHQIPHRADLLGQRLGPGGLGRSGLRAPGPAPRRRLALIPRPLRRGLALTPRPLRRRLALIPRPLRRRLALIPRPLRRRLALIPRPLVAGWPSSPGPFVAGWPSSPGPFSREEKGRQAPSVRRPLPPGEGWGEGSGVGSTAGPFTFTTFCWYSGRSQRIRPRFSSSARFAFKATRRSRICSSERSRGQP
jgi:hypothetical protein